MGVRLGDVDARITRSCLIEIAPDTFIADSNSNGVLHIEADGITVRFANGSVLRGAPGGRRRRWGPTSVACHRIARGAPFPDST